MSGSNSAGASQYPNLELVHFILQLLVRITRSPSNPMMTFISLISMNFMTARSILAVEAKADVR
jgi:Na+/H+ antiporter NhaC